jgi:Mg2+/Co2+ transporter CorB
VEAGFQIPGPVWLSATVIALLLAVSALFSISETALTAASRPRLHALARKGNRRAQLTLKLRDRLDVVLAAILLGNNFVNIVASAFATAALIELFGEAGIAYSAIAMTALVVLFGEVMPKTFAINRPVRVVLALAPAIDVAVRMLAPVSMATQAIARSLFRLIGVHRLERNPEAAVEELRGAIELHVAPDRAAPRERAMLRSILDLAEVEVAQIMVHRQNVLSINADQKPTAILEQALASPHTRIPLWRGQPENIVGVLHAKALLQALRIREGNPDAINIVEIAARPWFIPESTTLFDQLEAFRRRREHFALVVDEYGALLGVVTLEDILEEIVGEIAERHEFQAPGVRPQPDGSYIVDGHVAIRDLNRDLDWRLPDQHATTIAGLVLHEARRIPEVGQVFTFYGYRFEILRRKRNQIVALRVMPPPTGVAAQGDAGTPLPLNAAS